MGRNASAVNVCNCYVYMPAAMLVLCVLIYLFKHFILLVTQNFLLLFTFWGKMYFVLKSVYLKFSVSLLLNCARLIFIGVFMCFCLYMQIHAIQAWRYILLSILSNAIYDMQCFSLFICINSVCLYTYVVTDKQLCYQK